MSEFNVNWDWQLAFMADIKAILKSQAMNIVDIQVSTPEEDLKHSTDLKIKITAGDVAVRIRRDIPWRELTIRACSGGNMTEIHKLRAGYGDWYLYLWTGSDRIIDWILVNINKMRSAGLLSEQRPVKMNKDGYSGFVSYTIPELERHGCLVAKNMSH